MRIATMTNWAYGATVALTLASGAAMLLASKAEDRERAAVEQRARFDSLTASLDEDALRLTETARQYVAGGNPADLVVFRQEAAQLGSVEQRIAHLRDTGANPSELAALKDALHWADMLSAEQAQAIKAMQAGDTATAHKILFGAEYERQLDRIEDRVQRFQAALDRRSEDAVAEAARASHQLRNLSEVMVAVTALLFLFVLVFVIKQRILRPVVRLSDVVTRLAEQDYEVEPPHYDRIDEIGDMAQAVRIFRENGLARQRLERERAADEAMRDLVSRMTQRLQGCDGVADLSEVVSLFATQIAPAFSGRLYIRDERRDLMVETCRWQDPLHSLDEFPAAHCWGLRRGQIHHSGGAKVDIVCPHVGDGAVTNTICAPLAVRGETIGLLYLEQKASAEAAGDAEVYVELLAETVGLALANLRLRDALRQMALVDPLTGLSNRRELDRVLGEAAQKADRNGAPLACLMLDVDHFKQFNDQHGHDAGDAVLQAVGSALARATRDEGCAFRFGGEEFVLLMPGCDLASAQRRGEELLQKIRDLHVVLDGRSLGPVTASLGIATCPEHGSAQSLLQAADAALLRAKQGGRDRIVTAVVRGASAAA